jgi:choline kinase
VFLRDLRFFTSRVPHLKSDDDGASAIIILTRQILFAFIKPEFVVTLTQQGLTMIDSNRITTALLLAAGTGSRLRPLTRNAPKCLTEVGGRPILDRLIHNLRAKGFQRLVVVLGHQGDQIRDFLRHKADGMRVDYVFNPEYQTTNNLYSLWLARQQIQEPFLLVESDLVFEARMLDDMLYPDRIAISKLRPWMNGTTVVLGSGKRVMAFRPDCGQCDTPRYKTVNLYSLSLKTWKAMEKRLSDYVSDDRLGVYYEAVFTDMVADGSLAFDAVFFDADRWYEIDTLVDLDEAEKLYASPISIAGRSLVAIEPLPSLA